MLATCVLTCCSSDQFKAPIAEDEAKLSELNDTRGEKLARVKVESPAPFELRNALTWRTQAVEQEKNKLEEGKLEAEAFLSDENEVCVRCCCMLPLTMACAVDHAALPTLPTVLASMQPESCASRRRARQRQGGTCQGHGHARADQDCGRGQGTTAQHHRLLLTILLILCLHACMHACKHAHTHDVADGTCRRRSTRPPPSSTRRLKRHVSRPRQTLHHLSARTSRTERYDCTLSCFCCSLLANLKHMFPGEEVSEQQDQEADGCACQGQEGAARAPVARRRAAGGQAQME